MNPEERLDLLLDRAERGARLPTHSQTEAEMLAAAQRLTTLHQLRAPAAFADQLEARLRRSARMLQTKADTELELPVVLPTRNTTPTAVLRRRVATISLSSILVLTLLSWGVLVTSANSLPGDPLYGIKQFRNQIALSQASDPKDRAHLSITQLQSDITDLSQVVTNGHAATDIDAALSVVISATQQANDAVNALAASDRSAVQPDLQQTLTSESATLRSTLLHVPFAERVAFTTQLGALGDTTVPTVTQVSLARSKGELLTLTITGTHFAPGAQVFVDKHLYPASSQNATGTQMVVTVEDDVGEGHNHTSGVQNPDGTAAQAPNAVAQVTPVPGGTTTPGIPTPIGGDDGQHGTPVPGKTPPPDR
jgi:hypothetical protein